MRLKNDKGERNLSENFSSTKEKKEADVYVKRTTDQCFQATMWSHHFVTKSMKSEVKTPCGSLGGG